MQLFPHGGQSGGMFQHHVTPSRSKALLPLNLQTEDISLSVLPQQGAVPLSFLSLADTPQLPGQLRASHPAPASAVGNTGDPVPRLSRATEGLVWSPKASKTHCDLQGPLATPSQ